MLTLNTKIAQADSIFAQLVLPYELRENSRLRTALASGEEVAILTAQQHNHPLDDLKPCASLADVLTLKRAVQAVRISDELKRYIVDLVSRTRAATGVQLGASPRASIALMKTA